MILIIGNDFRNKGWYNVYVLSIIIYAAENSFMNNTVKAKFFGNDRCEVDYSFIIQLHRLLDLLKAIYTTYISFNCQIYVFQYN